MTKNYRLYIIERCLFFNYSLLLAKLKQIFFISKALLNYITYTFICIYIISDILINTNNLYYYKLILTIVDSTLNYLDIHILLCDHKNSAYI